MNRKPTPTLISSDPTDPDDDAARSLELMFAANPPIPANPPNQPLRPDLLHTIPIAQIVPSRWQPRTTFAPEPLRELANDIDRHGILTPPILWQNEDGEYELIAGERRLRAATALALASVAGYTLDQAVRLVAENGFVKYRARLRPHHTVPARLISGHAEFELHEIALVDNLLREDLNPLEEAHALQDLIDEYHYTQRDLASRIGKSQTWIAHRLNLLKLAPALAAQVTAGAIEPAIARDLARLPAASQAPILRDLQVANLKTKAASAYIAQLIDAANPDNWTGPDNRLLRHLLAAADETRRLEAFRPERPQSDARIPTPAKPLDTWQRDRIIRNLLGVPADARLDVTALWTQHAPAMGATCATCQFDRCRTRIAALTTAIDAAREPITPRHSWPQCDADDQVTTCPAHTPLGAPVRAYVSTSLRSYIQLNPDLPVRQNSSSPYEDYYATDINAWLQLHHDYLAWRAAKTETAKTETVNAVVAIIEAYQAAQPLVDPLHSHSQNCARCALVQRDGRCSLLNDPPKNDWHPEQYHRLWKATGPATPAGLIIGRCAAYRIRSLADLPDPAGSIDATPDQLLALLKRMSSVTSYIPTVPRWLNVARRSVYDRPSWDAVADYLRQHLPAATPARRLSLLLLWTQNDDPTWSETTLTLTDLAGAPITYTPYTPPPA